MKNDFYVRGQTIIEVLVALTTAIVIVSAITMVVITALRNVEYTKAQNTATRYAQEGMEFMRFMRDSNYTLFNGLAGGVPYCLDKGATVLYAPCPTTSNVDLFLRTITLEKNSLYCAAASLPTPTPTPLNTSTKVTVSVSWTDSKCASSTRCHQAKLVSCLSDYTVVPTP